ncbi:hypothetical protein ACIHFE_34230 [Streptomyces sp. NPDC052396]
MTSSRPEHPAPAQAQDQSADDLADLLQDRFGDVLDDDGYEWTPR